MWPFRKSRPSVEDAIRYALQRDADLSREIAALECQVEELRQWVAKIDATVMPPQ